MRGKKLNSCILFEVLYEKYFIKLLSQYSGLSALSRCCQRHSRKGGRGYVCKSDTCDWLREIHQPSCDISPPPPPKKKKASRYRSENFPSELSHTAVVPKGGWTRAEFMTSAFAAADRWITSSVIWNQVKHTHSLLFPAFFLFAPDFSDIKRF